MGSGAQLSSGSETAVFDVKEGRALLQCVRQCKFSSTRQGVFCELVSCSMTAGRRQGRGKERKQMTPIVAFDYGFTTQKTADPFPFGTLAGTTCCEEQRPAAYSISCRVGFFKDFCLRKIIFRTEYEITSRRSGPSMCWCGSGSAGPTRGDHMDNGHVEMAVREVKLQCRTLRTSSAQQTTVRIANDSPLLSWHLRFAAQVMIQMITAKNGKTTELRRTRQGWRRPMTQFEEKVWLRFKLENKDSRDLC